MSPYGSINTLYHVEVVVPNNIVEKWGHTKAYEDCSNAASRLVEASGQNSYSYSEVIEWGEAPNHQQCEDFIAHWHNWIIEHQFKEPT